MGVRLALAQLRLRCLLPGECWLKVSQVGEAWDWEYIALLSSL